MKLNKSPTNTCTRCLGLPVKSPERSSEGRKQKKFLMYVKFRNPYRVGFLNFYFLTKSRPFQTYVHFPKSFFQVLIIKIYVQLK